MPEDGPTLFHDVKSEVERLIEFSLPWHSSVLTIYIMQTYLVGVLNGVFYIGVVGPKGSGKTTVLEVATSLSYNGLLTGNISPAALARILDRGASVAADEVDELKGDILDIIQAALRHGYRRGSEYVRWNMNTNMEERLNTFGPKIMSFRGGIEDALQSRTFPLAMSPATDKQTIDRVLENMIRDETPLRTRLKTWAEEAMKEWTPKKLAELTRTDVFRDTLAKILGPIRTAREVEISSAMLLVSLIVGVNVLEAITQAAEMQREAEVDEEVQNLREFILGEWNERHRPNTIELEDIRIRYNLVRRDLKEKSYSQFAFRRIMREVGFRDGKELVRTTTGRDKGRAAVRLNDEIVERCLTVGGKALTEFRETLTGTSRSLTSFDTSLTASEEVHAGVRDLVVVLRKFLVERKGVPALCEEVATELEGTFPEDQIRRLWERWIKDGTLFEPSPGSGKYKLVSE